MSLFYNIVEEQEALMKQKGYDENSMDLAEKKGWFKRQFQAQLSLALNEAHRFNETSDFDIKLVGFFGRQAEMVVFNFKYEYDPETLELRIRNLSADLGDYKKTYALAGNDDLPVSFNVYRALKNIKNAKDCDSGQATIKKLIEDQELFLNELGLAYSQFNSQLDLFRDRFIIELTTCLKQNEMEKKCFLIKIELPSDQGSFTADFQYKFHPSEMELKLDYILTKKGEAALSFPIKEGEALPTIKRIEEALSFEIRKQNARLISDIYPTNSQRNQLKL